MITDKNPNRLNVHRMERFVAIPNITVAINSVPLLTLPGPIVPTAKIAEATRSATQTGRMRSRTSTTIRRKPMPNTMPGTSEAIRLAMNIVRLFRDVKKNAIGIVAGASCSRIMRSATNTLTTSVPART